MKILGDYILYLLLVALGLFLLYEGWPVIQRFFEIINRYKWIGVGIAAYGLFCYLTQKYRKSLKTIVENLDFMETLSHELTHAFVAITCMRRITKFHVERKNGVVWMTGGKWTEIVIKLSPYCVPIYTLIMLFLWSLVATRSLVANEGLMAIDVIIGITIAFHEVCFWQQTGDFQTDIKAFNKYAAYTFIWILRLLMLLIILLCYMPSFKTGQPLKLWGAVWYLIVQIWNDIIGLF